MRLADKRATARVCASSHRGALQNLLIAARAPYRADELCIFHYFHKCAGPAPLPAPLPLRLSRMRAPPTHAYPSRNPRGISRTLINDKELPRRPASGHKSRSELKRTNVVIHRCSPPPRHKSDARGRVRGLRLAGIRSLSGRRRSDDSENALCGFPRDRCSEPPGRAPPSVFCPRT